MNTPLTDHVQFDRMCATLEEFEPLPGVPPAAEEPEEKTEQESPLDGQILAGLVSPY